LPNLSLFSPHCYHNDILAFYAIIFFLYEKNHNSLFICREKVRRNIINTAYLHIINADNNKLNNLVEDEVINIIIFVVNFLLKPNLNVIIMYASYYELQYII